MVRFIIRRLLATAVLLFFISLAVFKLMSMAPGDVLDQLRQRPDVPASLVRQLEIQYGLTDAKGNPTPWYAQYAHWLNTVSPVKFTNEQGEFSWRAHFGPPSFGVSALYQVSVVSLISQRAPATLALALSSLLFELVLAIPLGVLAAVKKGAIVDRLTATLAYVSLSLPDFFLAMLALIFAAKSGWFPTGGLSAFDSAFLSPWARIWEYGWHLILPTVVLGLGGFAGTMRILRVTMLDYLNSDFVTTARAKGASESRVFYLHVLRNAINPLITSLGYAFAGLLSGAVLVENVMNYPGLGRLLLEAVRRKDEYVVMASVLLGCVMLMLGNLLADLLLAACDPRIRLEKPAPASSPRQRGATWALVIASLVVVLLGVGVEHLPWDSKEAMSRVMSVLEVIGAVILCVSGGAILVVSWPTLRQLGGVMRRRPTVGLAVLTLLLLYGAMVAAPFLGTQPYDLNNLHQTNHPPMRLVWRDGRWWAQIYERVDPATADYRPLDGQLLPLTIFGRGFEYGFGGQDSHTLKTTRHLLAPDYAALEKQLGHAVDRQDYPLYLLGSDSTGRDIFTRLLYGARISLTIGLVGIGITLTMGFLVGGLAGYFGGKFDFAAMRLVEFLMAAPTLYLLLALRAALAPYFEPGEMYLVIIIILSLIGWAGTARVLRGMSLSLRERPFVTASEGLGQSTFKILFRHFLPNLAGYLLVGAALSIPGYILGEASLSFLGLGIQEPSASWGLMLEQAQMDMKVLMLNFWWMLLPGAVIFLTFIAFNIVGDALRDIVDPKMKTGR